jgi:hypothetical protein
MWPLFVSSFRLNAKLINKDYSTKQFREIFAFICFVSIMVIFFVRQREPKSPAAWVRGGSVWSFCLGEKWFQLLRGQRW